MNIRNHVPPGKARKRVIVTLTTLLGAFCITAVSAGARAGESHVTAPSNGVAIAEANIQRAEQAPTFVAPPSFDVAKAKGKTVWWLDSDAGNILVSWFDAGKTALASVGVKVHAYDIGDGTPDTVNTALKLAVAGKAAAIVIGIGTPASEYSAGIDAAHAAGIPVFTAVNSIPGVPPKVPGVTADNTFDYEGAARLEADWIVAATKGKADVLTINYTGVSASQFMVPAFNAELKRLCPSCKNTVKTVSASISDLNSAFGSLTSTALLSDPHINWINPLYDSFVIYVQPALDSLQRSSSVGLLGFNGIAPLMSTLKKGGTSLQIDIGQPNEWLGYAIADNVLRALTGNPVITNLHIGNRIFTHASVQSLNVTSENDQTWYGLNLAQDYAKVWQQQ